LIALSPYRRLAQAPLVFLFAFAGAWTLLSQHSGALDPDTYYHFLVSQRLGLGQAWLDIGWLPLTVLGDAGPDHHWLWHLLLSPFAVDASESNVNLACSVAFALVPAGLTVFLQAMGVRYAGLWALLAVCSAVVVPGRMMMLRAQNLALLLILWILWALLRRRLAALVVAAFLYMASYHGAVVLVPICLFYTALVYGDSRRLDLAPGLAVAAGLLLALVVTPWPGQNLDYLLFHTLYKTQLELPGMAGTEWLRLPAIGVLREAALAHFLLVIALITRFRRAPRRPDLAEQLMLGVTGLFLALFVSAWRFVEYYAPLASLTAAVLMVRQFPSRGRADWQSWLQPLAVAALVTLGAAQASRAVLSTARFDPRDYREVTSYLSGHARTGELVVNTHWPDFPMLLWPEGHQHFVAGLDGSYLAFSDPERFLAWWHLGSQGIAGNTAVAAEVVRVFSARWVAVNRAHTGLIAALERDSAARRVAESARVVLFEISVIEP
jgi:hypothetical protein